MNFPEMFEEYRSQFILGLAGLFLLGVGVLSVVVVSFKSSGPEVEILSSDEAEDEEGSEIIIDVEGAVEKPGLYQISSEARVNDALVAAGGLSAKADREWVSLYINLAHKLTDGVKIYVPSIDENQAGENVSNKVSEAITYNQGEVIGLQTKGKISINSASASELDSLWGIGEKRASAIIESRPYGSIEELRDRNIIPMSVYERIKDEISI